MFFCAERSHSYDCHLLGVYKFHNEMVLFMYSLDSHVIVSHSLLLTITWTQL